ncbi:hypothetical protein [Streptomyces sp. NPDC101234]|uniref:hypothetical protein n=1 Tax=Streptomyces sp. NPDC101234 TaxID=3366138 RepID=UPI00381CC6FB
MEQVAPDLRKLVAAALERLGDARRGVVQHNRHLRSRFRHDPRHQLRVRVVRILDDLRLAGRSQDHIAPHAGDRPLLPFLLGHGEFGLDTVGLLTQSVDSVG